MWQIWSYTAQNKFCQKLYLVGFEPTTFWSSVSCSPNSASKESVGDFWSEFSFVSWTTSHVELCLFLESIEHNFIKALMIHIHNQIVRVGRAGDWWSGGCEFKPHLGQFLMKFILFYVTLDLSDNLTEMRQTGLSWKTQLEVNGEVNTQREMAVAPSQLRA